MDIKEQYERAKNDPTPTKMVVSGILVLLRLAGITAAAFTVLAWVLNVACPALTPIFGSTSIMIALCAGMRSLPNVWNSLSEKDKRSTLTALRWASRAINGFAVVF